MTNCLKVVPAYGKDYPSKETVQDAWNLYKDFKISDISSEWDGKFVNRTDVENEGTVDAVVVRYGHLRKVVVLSHANRGWLSK